MQKVLRLGVAAAAFALLAGTATTAHGSAGPASSGSPAAAVTAKGTVGWDTYRRLDQLPMLSTGVQTQQFSSFDRSGGNGDFSHCLAQTGEGCVIAQRSGAGEIDSIWFTRDGGDVSATGNITIELDGKTVLHADLQDVVNGGLGAPFVYPLVANADQSSGGDYILVPMPFRSSMRVITDVDPIYYHVSYRSFADSYGVKTFDPSDPATDVIAKLRATGTADPKPAQPNVTTQSSSFDLAPGSTKNLATEHGSGLLTAVSLHLPQLAVAVGRRVNDDGRAFGANGYDQYTVAIDPGNDGLRLTRRLDASIGNQDADVLVDGIKVAQWTGLPAAPGQWRNQSVYLPASATAGKSSIVVRDSFVSSDVDYNTFTYWVASKVGGSYQHTDTVDVGPDHTAAEAAHGYTIVGQTFEGSRDYSYPPSAADQRAAAKSTQILQHARLQISFDGRVLVNAPIGQFFGSGLGGYEVNALMSSVHPTTRTLTAWWPMPYRSSASVALVNNSGARVTGAGASVSASRNPAWGQALADGSAAYFHATANAQPTTPGKDYLFLQASGRGKFVGVSHQMQGPTSRGYLEGDERVYVDGSHTPQIHGTGTEDFYEGGWYFNRETFSDPFNGESAHETGTSGCPSDEDCTSTYREMLADGVPFSSSITFGIEHGGVDDVQADYSSTAFWYGATGDGLRWSDGVDVGNAASESAHQYSGGDASTLTATFEGNDGPQQPVTDDLRTAASPVRFRVAVDPHNTGVTLRRTSDQTNAYQSATVRVDGKLAGDWIEPLGNASHAWLDDAFAIPARLTVGKAAITVSLTPDPGAPAWTAASYAVLSQVPPFTDRQAPTGVSGLSASSGATNQVTLSWQPASDNVYAPSYAIYASQHQGFRPSAANLVGTSDVPAFTHTGLGLQQTWYYRVVAVDAAGNRGPASAEASATTGSLERIEAETLLPPVEATAPVESQGDCCGVSWSGGAQLWFRPSDAPEHVTLSFDVPQDGSYAVTGVLTRAPDYGIVELALDGTTVGAPFDGYDANGVAVSPPLDYGTHVLGASQHTLTLTVTGKNPAAANYLAGLDYLDLQLTG